MSQINKYNNEAAYLADNERDSAKSALSLRMDTGNLVYDGVNVITTNPQCGDIIFHDAAKKVFFVKLDTYNASAAPSGWVPMGVVAYREGDKAAIVSPSSSQSYRFLNVLRMDVTGMKLDGVEHTSSVVLDGVASGSFVYIATTKAEFAQQLNTWLSTHSPSGYPYSCYLDLDDSDRVILQYDNYSKHPSTTTMSGMSLAYTMDVEGAGYRHIVRSGDITRGIFNLDRAVQYFRQDLSSDSFNPLSTIPTNPWYIVCLPAYLGTSQYRDADYGATIRAKYGEGEEGWLNYMRWTVIDETALRAGTAPHLRNTKKMTEVLGSKLYLKPDGTTAIFSPYVNYIHTFGYEGVQGCDIGDWQGVSVYDNVKIMKVIKYGLTGVARTADPINRSLQLIGKRAYSCSANYWLLPPCSGSSGLYSQGNGYCGETGARSGLGAVPLLLYDLSASEN